MKWIITWDHTEPNQQRSMVGTANALGQVNRSLVHALPREAFKPFMEAAVRDLPFEFQLRDDDGEPMLDGRCEDLGEQDEMSAFQPLDYFASIYGTTEMWFRKVGASKWEAL